MKKYTYKKRDEYFERALKAIPMGLYGHQGPVNSCALPVSAFPILSSKAKGNYFWDMDGNRFMDYMCAYGPNVLGYADDDVDKAAFEQSKLGDAISAPHYRIIEFAELMTNKIANADWAFFAKNGGDVTNLAVLTARAATGRKKILMLEGCYHGVAQWTQAIGFAGIIEEDVANNLYTPFNDVAAFEKIVNANKGQIACFISAPYHVPAFTDSILPNDDWWPRVQEICKKNGIVLIIDDIRCGFRLNMSGSADYFGIKPDLQCFCKALANGYNVSALVGTNAMRAAVSDVFYTGSYWMSSIPYAAGLACINKLEKINGPQYMIDKGKKLFTNIQEVAKQNGFNLVISGITSMPFIRLENDDNCLLHQQWVAECVQRGAFLANHHNLFINCAITDEDIQLTTEIADEAYKVVKEANKL